MYLRIPKASQRNLEVAVLKDFSGGLVTDVDELNLGPKFLTEANNVICHPDGTVRVRYGVEKVATLPAGIVNITYYNGRIIAVLNSGVICSIDARGIVAEIWSPNLAAQLPNKPKPWGYTGFASFASFNGKLYVANGVDKPLYIDTQFKVQYLYDIPTNTNVNVPIGRYIVAVGEYLVIFGDPVHKTRVHISARNAPGTWYGDTAPNDGTFIDVGTALSGHIRGGTEFRDKLLIMFSGGTIIGTLGVYNDAKEHTPKFDDVVADYGSVAHRTIIATGDDAFISGYSGVSTIKRTAFSTSLKPEPLSVSVNVELTKPLYELTAEDAEDYTFSVLDRQNNLYMLFIPHNVNGVVDKQKEVFVYSFSSASRHAAWTRFSNFNFSCGCATLLNNLYFGDADGNLWRFGNDVLPVYTDNGAAITFSWATPWVDMGARGYLKESKYIGMDTSGKSEFTVECFVDRFNRPFEATNRLVFSGGSQGQFGDGDQPYGGGRNTSYERLYAWTNRFKLCKFRFSGESSTGLSWASLILRFRRIGIRQ